MCDVKWIARQRDGVNRFAPSSSRAANYPNASPLMTYEQFFGALMVPWCGMWLGIEPDGYTHS